MRAPSQYVCSLDNQRTEAPSGRVSRTWRLATSISVTSLEPTLKTYTVSRPPPPPAAVADCVGAELVSEDDAQTDAMSPSAALITPLRTVRRSRLEDRNQSEPPTNTPFASPREAQSSGAQCEGGWADARGFTIAFDIVCLLQGHDLPRSSSRLSGTLDAFRRVVPLEGVPALLDAAQVRLHDPRPAVVPEEAPHRVVDEDLLGDEGGAEAFLPVGLVHALVDQLVEDRVRVDGGVGEFRLGVEVEHEVVPGVVHPGLERRQ